jgi:hypothetical protein
MLDKKKISKDLLVKNIYINIVMGITWNKIINSIFLNIL